MQCHYFRYLVAFNDAEQAFISISCYPTEVRVTPEVKLKVNLKLDPVF